MGVKIGFVLWKIKTFSACFEDGMRRRIFGCDDEEIIK
jgi:hypothetical protein